MSRLTFVALAALAGLVACGPDAGQQGSVTQAAATPDDAGLMQQGMQQLYQQNDPVAAEQTFRAVLAHTSTHYGARYQLAVALDRGGRPAEARREWTEVLRDAKTYNDSASIRTAQSRLAAPDTAGPAAMMVHGLDLLYRQNNPTDAATQFRAVLKKNPTHYGATYQLATALDRAGRQGEARELWVKVLGMATTYKDEKTATTARARLASAP